jgi:hypothetical protein
VGVAAAVWVPVGAVVAVGDAAPQAAARIAAMAIAGRRSVAVFIGHLWAGELLAR